MSSFDHAQYGPVLRKKALRGQLPDIGLLVAAAVVARCWIGSSSNFLFDHLLIALSVLFALFLFPLSRIVVGMVSGVSWSAIGVSFVGLAIVQSAALGVMYALDQAYWPIPDWVAGWFVMSATGLAALHAFRMWRSNRMKESHAMRNVIAIIGHGWLCVALANRVIPSPFRVAAVFDTSGTSMIDTGDVMVHRELTHFVECVRCAGISEIWIVLPLKDADHISDFVSAFRNDLVNIRFVPDLTGVAPFESRRTNLSDMPALDIVASPLSTRARVAKAVFDRIFAGLALIGIAPLMAAIAIAVKLSSPGPVLFRQKRMGAYGRIFTIYKFRTMYTNDAEPSGEVRQATRGDARVTRVGALLRRTSLDELPQFLNVLKGDMSVVGPRPHAVEHDVVYRDLVDGYIHRYRVKPGITGWAQVNGLRGETDRVEKMRRRVEHDLYYLNNWSFSLDVRIVLRTIATGFFDKHAY
ncbi:undecaprenyl-phosphate glucose phosphotransferase [Burkholderia cepacia]|uniref:Undecaprenyl-phosphate glucose phosphotransferase n=1 Tax=Burkholderia cepacia TaxID=292 RepID=A0AAQ0FJM3_BURCE|nr:undecaprenyl-phosphate glucose phosphotransferase [Burkholderia cepacia]RAQ16207.1 undecaprenyl-phosphate glucose phosphotransferase [Burkholderia cepacia]